MTVVIPTDDKISIARRTGQAIYFAIYRIKNGHLGEVEFKSNPQKHNHQEKPKHHHDHPEIIKILAGVDVLLFKNLGKYMKADLQNNGIDYVKISETNLNQIINQYLAKQ